MQNAIVSSSTLPVFTGSLRTPPEALLRNPVFMRELVAFYANLGLSGDQTLDFVLINIYYGQSGTLYDYTGAKIDVEAWMVHEHFGAEPRRWLNAFKTWLINPPQQRLQHRIIERVMALYLAKEIFEARKALALA